MSAKTIVLISGSNQGLGFFTVKALANSNIPYHIFVCGRSIESAHNAIAEAQSFAPNSLSDLSALQLDVSSDSSISAALESVQAKFGKLDVLVNNAGENQHQTTIEAGNADTNVL